MLMWAAADGCGHGRAFEISQALLGVIPCDDSLKGLNAVNALAKAKVKLAEKAITKGEFDAFMAS